ncbi:hypothetical protein A7E78_06865 [Syntrophotalea acetylenivorans]|uniref:Uncharacterized protein n=1 Tax=Syntrophotalea acetylenivorans TaxID=1842532 RepID=A0A1L3GNV6_9BACT|nr:hypothetical protein A7E78_06865 [Syntrophotalea acetylenivorans]
MAKVKDKLYDKLFRIILRLKRRVASGITEIPDISEKPDWFARRVFLFPELTTCKSLTKTRSRIQQDGGDPGD